MIRAAWHGAGPLTALVLLGSLAACSSAGATRAGTASDASSSPDSTVDQSATPTPSTSAATSPSPSALPARFRGTVSRIPPDLEAEMRGTTWRPGCPVDLSDFRLLTLRYWGFDGAVHEGPMVVNESVAADVVWVFRRLFEARFPIKRMHLSRRYRPNHDDPNDRRDYTASFNCRPVITPRGPLGTWSQHSYGWAIDINPIENPYVGADGYVRNRNARPFRDRSLDVPGMIHPGDVVVRSFATIGWGWGGSWSSGPDYMHFSLTGR